MYQNIHISLNDNTSRFHTSARTMIASLILPEILARVFHHSTLDVNA